MINRIIKMTMLHYGGMSRDKQNWVKGGGGGGGGGGGWKC